MKMLVKIALGAAAFAISGGAFAQQVRTFGPIAPYLTTGRSVSVPPFPHADEQPYDEAGPRHTDTSRPAAAPARAVEPPAK